MPMVKANQVLKNIIQDRQSTRAPFDSNRPIKEQDLMQVLEAGRWTPAAHNMQNFEIVVVDDKELLEAIGNIEFPISEDFFRENYQLLSFSEQELLQKRVGILGTMFPPAFRRWFFRASEPRMRHGKYVAHGPISRACISYNERAWCRPHRTRGEDHSQHSLKPENCF